ncbi:MAG: surface-adhesin E family protein [Gallionella sp.]
MKAIVKLVLLAGQILLLSSCALLTELIPPERAASTALPASKPDKVSVGNAEPDQEAPATKVPSLSFKLDPSQSITIDQLKVSYSMIAVPDDDGYFVRLSLVFTNLSDRRLSLNPVATLRDARESGIKAYSKAAFLRLTAQRKESANRDVIDSLISNNNDGRNSARDRSDWAEAYWLKSRLGIPPQGIALGGLVFHADKLILPMKLSVSVAGQNYVFDANDSVRVLNRKYQNEYRMFDMFIGVANSKSGITAYAVPSSIRKNGDRVEMWSLFDFSEAETSATGQSYLSARSLNEYECGSGRSRLLAFSWHSENMGGGKVVFNNSDAQGWAPIAPDSLEGFIWKYACWKQ